MYVIPFPDYSVHREDRIHSSPGSDAASVHSARTNIEIRSMEPFFPRYTWVKKSYLKNVQKPCHIFENRDARTWLRIFGKERLRIIKKIGKNKKNF